MIKGMQEVIDIVARVKETFENNGGLNRSSLSHVEAL